MNNQRMPVKDPINDIKHFMGSPYTQVVSKMGIDYT
tara:strand:- start:754 stop:861 length:108 start_codon:yes stop_codon:yes gene_type:complete